MKKRILSMLLVIVMVLSLVPVTALAEGDWRIVSSKPDGYIFTNDEQVTLSLVDGSGNPITEGVSWTVGTGLTEVPTSEPGKCKVTGSVEGDATVTAEYNGVTKAVNFKVYKTPDTLTIV